MILTISSSLVQDLVKLANNWYPAESCALLAGSINNLHYKYEIQEIFPIINEDNSPISFRISENQLFHTTKEIESNGHKIVGIYHSHPYSSSFPSAIDREYMVINPVPWIIYSVPENVMKSFLLEELDIIKEVKIIILS